MWVGMQRMTDLALGWRARADHSGDAPREIPPPNGGANSGLELPTSHEGSPGRATPQGGGDPEQGGDRWTDGQDWQSARGDDRLAIVVSAQKAR